MNAIFTQTALIFQLIAVSGIIGHAVLKWAKGELTISITDYFFKANRKASTLMLLTSIGGVAGAMLAGQLNDAQNGAQILVAWGIGYMSDSAVNRQA